MVESLPAAPAFSRRTSGEFLDHPDLSGPELALSLLGLGLQKGLHLRGQGNRLRQGRGLPRKHMALQVLLPRAFREASTARSSRADAGKVG